MTPDEIYDSIYPYSPSDTDGMTNWQAFVHVSRQFWGWVISSTNGNTP